jgi:predicted site-specific integrase-resolvase
MNGTTSSPFLTVREAATYLRLSKWTLRQYALDGNRSQLSQHGGRVYYHEQELTDLSSSSRAQSTSPITVSGYGKLHFAT